MVRMPKVEEITDLDRSTIYRIADFPEPVRLTPGTVAWVEDEVVAWLQARAEARGSEQDVRRREARIAQTRAARKARGGKPAENAGETLESPS
jgi:prophage regulatory protein